jgi:Ca2+/Na+ antiporter
MIFIVGIVFLIALAVCLAEAYYERDFPRRTIIFLLVMTVALLLSLGAFKAPWWR